MQQTPEPLPRRYGVEVGRGPARRSLPADGCLCPLAAPDPDLSEKPLDLTQAEQLDLIRDVGSSVDPLRLRPQPRDEAEAQKEVLHVTSEPLADRGVRNAALAPCADVDGPVAREKH